MRYRALTKEEIRQWVNSKQLGYTFVREHGVSYWGFRKWLKVHHQEGIKSIKGYEDIYVKFYKRFLYQNRRFEDKYNINYGTFRDWLKRTYNVNMSEVMNLPVYVREYKNWKRSKRK